MNCDLIARPYRWIEYAAFGRKLEQHRFHFLSETSGSREALLLGDGDGRFAAALAKTNSLVQIDCIELSRKMIRVAKELLGSKQILTPSRVSFVQGDALSIKLRSAHYDLVVTNFFLDCFSDSQTLQLIEMVRANCRHDARWIVSDFQQPSSGWRALHAKIWLRTMYFFFRLATGLQTNRLPCYHKALRSAGFRLQSSHNSMAGLIRSELWIFTEQPSNSL